MKRRRALLFTLTVVLALCAACGFWLHRERQQYALNRQLIDALVQYDAQQALTLVNAGADPNTRVAPPPIPSLKLLLNQLLYHQTPDTDSPTAFMLACGKAWQPSPSAKGPLVIATENLPLLQTMLAHHVRINDRAKDNSTALYHAADRKRWRTVELLLQHGADVNAPDNSGMTPLHLAAMSGSRSLLSLLLTHGANVNSMDTGYGTPLGYAIIYEISKDMMMDLLAHGADPNLPNKNGDTPLLLAQKMHRPDLVRLLKEHRAK